MRGYPVQGWGIKAKTNKGESDAKNAESFTPTGDISSKGHSVFRVLSV